MNSDRLARFLLTRTVPGFRWGLRSNPYLVLRKAGFHAGEVAQLVASIEKFKRGRPKSWNVHELEQFALTFNFVAVENVAGSTSASDDWTN